MPIALDSTQKRIIEELHTKELRRYLSNNSSPDDAIRFLKQFQCCLNDCMEQIFFIWAAQNPPPGATDSQLIKRNKNAEAAKPKLEELQIKLDSLATQLTRLLTPSSIKSAQILAIANNPSICQSAEYPNAREKLTTLIKSLENLDFHFEGEVLNALELEAQRDSLIKAQYSCNDTLRNLERLSKVTPKIIQKYHELTLRKVARDKQLNDLQNELLDTCLELSKQVRNQNIANDLNAFGESTQDQYLYLHDHINENLQDLRSRLWRLQNRERTRQFHLRHLSIIASRSKSTTFESRQRSNAFPSDEKKRRIAVAKEWKKSKAQGEKKDSFCERKGISKKTLDKYLDLLRKDILRKK